MDRARACPQVSTAIAIMALIPGCSGGAMDPPPSADPPSAEPGSFDAAPPMPPPEPGDDPLADPSMPPPGCLPPTATPRRELARRVEDYMINYGSWDEAELALGRTHDLVILDPKDGVTREQVESLQAGDDPDDPCRRVLVLCYISIGEDIRTVGLSDADLAADPRFVGDGTGPRRDPRGPFASGQPLTGIDPLGLPSNGGTGYASWYLDDNDVYNHPENIGDGRPDRNGNFDGAFVNAGDPKWFEALQNMTVDGPDGVPGLREILTTTYGRGLGCDGVFLDTIDTAAPNRWTNASSSNESKYEWTAPGFGAFIQRLRSFYPDAVILQNRGVFYFNPRHEQYRFMPRGNVDFVLYESYRLNSDSWNNPHPYHYPNNRYNFAPKLMAEANRSNGFRALSVGYAEGPGDVMSEDTLVGNSTLGFDSLLEDIHVTERLAGFRHYLTNSSLTLVNPFVLTHANREDLEPPVWTSTYNDNDSYPEPPGAPSPRVGIQHVSPGPGSLTIRWDGALDLNRVGYALYLQTTPFDFASDPELEEATRFVLVPRSNAGYAAAVRSDSYPNQATITGLVPGQKYYLVLRAYDDSPAANEEMNQVVKTGTPAAEGPYLGRASASNDTSTLRYSVDYEGSWKLRRVYIDRDQMEGTGYAIRDIGADWMLEEDVLYRHTGGSLEASWTEVPSATVTMTTTSAGGGLTTVEWKVAESDIGSGHRRTNLVFEVARPGEAHTGFAREHVYTTRDPMSPYIEHYIDNDADRVYFHADIQTPFGYRHVFIDSDANARTGYSFAGIGADHLIENGALFRHAAGAQWDWIPVGSASESVSGTRHTWSAARSDLGVEIGSPIIEVVFQAQDEEEAPFTAPAQVHLLSR